jgi:hypothetical protein
MSTKVTIKSRPRSDSEPGFRLYDDVLDEWLSESDGTEQPVYLFLEGVEAEMRMPKEGGAAVTVKLPRELARALGLVP